MTRRELLTRTLCLSIALSATALMGCGPKQAERALPAGSHVVALGDSLTYGYGAAPDSAYPKVLSELTGWQITNDGVNGDTSAQVLARSDAIVARQPDLVLLGVGGNDALRKMPPTTVASNITATVQKFTAADIPVVLIAEPHYSIRSWLGDSDDPIYRDIAKAQDVPLFARDDGGWSMILADKALTSDPIHANAKGYRVFAQNLYAFLQETGYVAAD